MPRLRGVDIEVHAGEVVGVVGPKQSGVDVLLDVVSGFVKPITGEVVLEGRDVTRLPAHRRAALGIRRTYSRDVPSPATAFQHLLGAQHGLATYTAVGGVLGTGHSVVEEHDLRHRAHAVLAKLGVDDVTRLSSLPAAVRRRVGWAAALITRPRLLVMQEPTAGASLRDEPRILDGIRGLAGGDVDAILVADDHVPLVLAVADFVYCLASGRVVAAGSPDEVRVDPGMHTALLGAS
jgi:branched-chain amino acid transport system ATP-binding protein